MSKAPSRGLAGHDLGERREIETPLLKPDGALSFGFSYVLGTGDVVWIAGQVPHDRDGNLVGGDDIEAQAVQVVDKVEAVVEKAGGTLADVVSTSHSTDHADRAVVNDVRQRYFAGPPFPAATLVIIMGFGIPEYLVEIEAVAALRGAA